MRRAPRLAKSTSTPDPPGTSAFRGQAAEERPLSRRSQDAGSWPRHNTAGPRPIRAHLHLALGHSQRVGKPRALWACQVLGLLESLLQREDLLARERRPRVFLLAILVQDPSGLGYEEERMSAVHGPRPAPLLTATRAGHLPEPVRRGSLQGEPCTTPGQKMGGRPGSSASGLG